ncbi:MAG: hypothetical protein U0559_11225 [Anaerolineae bacterium]
MQLVPSGINGGCFAAGGNEADDRRSDARFSLTVTPHIPATDNVSVSQMFIREWYNIVTAPALGSDALQRLGALPGRLRLGTGSRDGTHFVGVWVQDAAHNISRLERRAFDFASLVQPGASVFSAVSCHIWCTTIRA